jgi:hypothetical protein
MSPKTITRRDFLKVAAAAPLAGAAGPAVRGLSSTPLPAPGQDKVRVVLVRDPSALGPGGAPAAEVVQKMLDDGVKALLGETDIVKAWKGLVRPDDIVGIKTNVWGSLPTTAEVEQAIKRRVMDAGVAEDRIGIDDRGVLRNPVFQKATALINARPMRAHDWAGVGSLIKNYIMFTPQPSAWHGDTCADLAKIWDLPIVKGKTRLNVLVMFTPLFDSAGPHVFLKEYTWEYKGLILSRDPVAADATGLRVIQAKRKAYFGDDRALPKTPHHIQLADARHHLGTSDPDRIELVKLGWAEGALI